MTLRAHTLKPAPGARHSLKRVGRGNASGHGNYSGHGGKGQTARSGGNAGLKLKGFKMLLQSTPKLRGFKSLSNKPRTLTLTDLEKNFNEGEVVTIATLREKKVVGKTVSAVKVVNTGELKKKLVLEGIKTTKTVMEKITSLGGEVK